MCWMMCVTLQITYGSTYIRTLTDAGIDHTDTKLNIEACTDEQLNALGKKYLMPKEMYRLRPHNYFKAHKEEFRETQ